MKVKCADCGNMTEVPFVPDGRPVYCKKCYQKYRPKRMSKIPKNRVRREDRPAPRVYRQYSDKFDPDIVEKMKSNINREAIERSKYNNMIVKELSFYDSMGEYYTVSGGLVNSFHLTPRKPMLICDFIRFNNTHVIKEGIDEEYICRICGLDPSQVCHMTNEKLSKKQCFGIAQQGASYEFYVISNGEISGGDWSEKKFKIGFFNKSIKNGYDKEDFLPNPNRQKAESLKDLYEKMMSGIICVPTALKPGNIIFHTLFSGEVSIDMMTSKKEHINGLVKAYEYPPGHYPALKIWTKENDNSVEKDVVKIRQLYAIERIIVEDFKLDSLTRRRAMELLMNGHTIIPHPGTDQIFDYCKSATRGDCQMIDINGNINPREMLDDHDMEIDKILSNVR